MSTDPFAFETDLWVLPPPRLSAWFPRVDWYLNWQLSKGLAYSGLNLPSETLHLMEQYETPLPRVPEADAEQPLLVLSHNRLPAAKCVVVEMASGLKPWLERVHQIALDLGAKNARVFLPSKATLEEAEKVWGHRPVNASFSTDTEARKIL